MPDCRMIVFRPLPWRRRLLRRVAIACAAVIGIAALLQPIQAAGGWPR